MTNTRGKKKIIVCADDFGYSPGVNTGIIQSLHSGFVLNTAVMIREKYVDEIIPFIKENMQYSFGLHLVIENYDTINTDLEKQIKLFQSKIGINPEHLSLHSSQKIIQSSNEKTKNEVIWNIYKLSKKYSIYLRGTKSDKVLSYRADPTLSKTKTNFESMLSHASNGITEIIVHPGTKDDRELVSSYSALQRNNELKILTKTWKETINKTEYQIGTYKQFIQ